MTDDAPRYSSLRDYARLLRKQWLLIALPAVVAFGAALFYSLHQPKTYQGQAQVEIQDETQQLTLLGTAVAPGSSTASVSAIIAAQTFDTPQVAASVARRIGSGLGPAAVLADTSLSVDPTSGLLDVGTATAGPTLTAQLANAYAAEIAARTTAATQHQLQRASVALQRRLRALRTGDAGERSVLSDEISRLDFLRSTATPAVVVKAATVPGSPSSPKPTRDAALGLLAGLLLGIVLAFARESFDRRMRGSSQIGMELGFRLVGQVRKSAMGSVLRPGATADKGELADVEAFRIMRQNVELMLAGRDRRILLVTSALPQEGKSTVAASLAMAFSAAGHRTLLVEADLRRPSLTERLRLGSRPGLREYLSGTASSSEVVGLVPGAPSSHNGDRSDSAGDADAEAQLVMISAGGASKQSAELLGSDRMRSLLEQTAEVYHVVIIDSAPLLPVADTLALLPFVSSALLCVRSGRTTAEQAAAARTALGPVSREVTGVVVTHLRARDEPSGYGMYAYDYGYTGAADG